MARLYLRVEAPFAAYRGMQAGVYRASAPMMPPSAALGLVLNLAGVELRGDDSGVTTDIRADAPRLRLALGLLGEPPGTGVLYQQLHSYPVGHSGKELRPLTQGAKYWIAPARRELLLDLAALIGIETDDTALLGRVVAGLGGAFNDQRYGLPFAGDNNLLFDRIEVVPEPPPARWYTPVVPEGGPRRGSHRFTVGINRLDSSRTTTVLLAPLAEAQAEPPEDAWQWTPG